MTVSNTLKNKTYTLLDPQDNCSLASSATNFVIVLIIVASVVALTLETEEHLFTLYRTEFGYFEIFASCFFTIEYIARLWSASSNKEFRSYRHYFFSYNSIIDLIALFPLYLSLLGGMDLRFIMLLRLFRLLRLFKYLAPLVIMVEVFKAESRAFISALLVMLVLVFLSAVGIYFFENEVQQDAFGSIPDAMWWSIVTLTTLGYGDVVPITIGGRVFTGLMTVFAVGIVSLPAGMLASRFSEELHKRKLIFSEKLQEIKNEKILSRAQQHKLETIRQQLCLSKSDADLIFKTVSMNSVKQDLSKNKQNCPHCGKIFKSGE